MKPNDHKGVRGTYGAAALPHVALKQLLVAHRIPYCCGDPVISRRSFLASAGVVVLQSRGCAAPKLMATSCALKARCGLLNGIIVHGTIRTLGVPFGHAWLELDGKVYDAVDDKFFDVADFYRDRAAIALGRFTPKAPWILLAQPFKRY